MTIRRENIEIKENDTKTWLPTDKTRKTTGRSGLRYWFGIDFKEGPAPVDLVIFIIVLDQRWLCSRRRRLLLLLTSPAKPLLIPLVQRT